MGMGELFEALCGDVGMMISTMLIVGVIFVNGWTDAPNAITASVSTGALKMREAVVLAAFFNFLGALVMGLVNTSVMNSVGNITMLVGADGRAIPLLCSALVSIIIWAIVAWSFGIPTSESHALISGILGAALAIGAKITPEALKALKLAAVGLLISLPIGGALGWLFGWITGNISLNMTAGKRTQMFQMGQKIGASAMAFMHGAQDSQKFAGVFLAAVCMSGAGEKGSEAPVWLVVLCAVIISLGTSVGGYRIIKKVGIDTVELTSQTGFAADLAAFSCMLMASLGGVPVSTTHTATSAVIGAGISKGKRKPNLRSIKDMILAWVLTFPCCGLISFLSVKLFLLFAD